MVGTLTVFGYPSTQAHLEVRARSLRWRGLRGAFFLGGGLVLAPLVGLLPPHVPWVVATLGLGGFLGLRKWRERYTIVSLQGPCPRCGGAMTLPSSTPLRPVLSVPCDECHHDARLTTVLPEGA